MKKTEKERTAHIHFLESLERVDRVIKQEVDAEKLLWAVVQSVFEIFGSDRAWLLYPCDPEAPTYRVPVEVTRPEYPGANELNLDVPMKPGADEVCRALLASDGPVTFGPGGDNALYKEVTEQFGVQSQMITGIYPKTGAPWIFGMHQCSHPRIWTGDEKKLFNEIGHRISDGLNSVLFLRELQENEERFRATFEQAAVGIAHVALDGRWLRVNQKLCDIVGYSKEALLQKTFQDITHPDDLDADQEFVRQILAKEIITYSMEKRYIRKDGSSVWINLTVSMVRNVSGDPAYFISVIEDIAQRKQAEEELRKSEQRFRTLLQRAAEGILVAEIHTKRFIYANPAVCKLLGYSEKELTQMTVFDIHPEKDLNHVISEFEAQTRGEKLRAADIPCLRKTGEVIFADVSAAQALIEGKECTIGFFSDTTERKQVEETLRESESKYRGLVENQPVGVIIHLQTGEIVFANRAMCRIMGDVSEDEIVGKNALDFVHPDFTESVISRFQKAIETNTAQPSAVEKLIRPEGQVIVVEITGAPILYMGETAVMVMIVDITERKQMEMEKEKLQQQLLQAQKMESVGRLAGGVAHDFNNILGIILGYTEEGLDEVDCTHPVHANLIQIEKASRRAADLTRQLLAFARKQTISPKIMDLNDTVTGMLTMIRRLIGEDIDLVWLPSDKPWSVKMDPGQVDQILANLCVNARDAITGVGKITIETANVSFDVVYCAAHAGFVPGEYVQLTVSDNGCGIGKDALNTVFDPFYTTKEIGKGTGLGLSTVYGIVKQNKGFINVYSELNQGTTFRIYFPRYKGKNEVTSAGLQPREVFVGREIILLVEDELALLTLCRRKLEKLGYRVLAAGTPGEAIALAEEYAGEIDLLMTDVVMPEMNGRDLCKRLQSLYPNLKRLFMSGYTANVIVHHGILEESVCFIQKPFTLEDLSDKVRQALEKE